MAWASGTAALNSYAFMAGINNPNCVTTTPAPGDDVDNDCDGYVDEEEDNGIDDDGDGKVDEDLAPLPRQDGNWGDWLAWGSCSLSCGAAGSQTRIRNCDNPPMQNNGEDCKGDGSQSKTCHMGPCSVDGNWASWGAWSTCSSSCAAGTRTHTRTCTDPAPFNGGAACAGSDTETGSCDAGACPGECPTGWEKRAPYCYKLEPGASTTWSWQDSQSRCQADGAWLAEPRDAATVTYINDLAYSKSGAETIWLGLRDSRTEGRWQYETDGADIMANDWKPPDEPNDWGTGEDCAEWRRSWRNEDGEWNDYPCNEPGGYICQTNVAAVDGNWSPWGAWSACSVTCENGTYTHTRSCSNPAPAHGGASCTGPDSFTTACTPGIMCPIDGGWGSWGGWGECSITCLGVGVQERERTCDNPPPKYNGASCPGSAVDDLSCDRTATKCESGNPWESLFFSPPPNPNPVDGGVGPWSNWTHCTMPCGGGVRMRVRFCNNPTPVGTGAFCTEPLVEEGLCNTQACTWNGYAHGWMHGGACNDASRGLFDCKSGLQCIPIHKKCDCVAHCDDKSDEDVDWAGCLAPLEDCLSQAPNIRGSVLAHALLAAAVTLMLMPSYIFR